MNFMLDGSWAGKVAYFEEEKHAKIAYFFGGNSYCLPICVSRQLILKVAVVPMVSVTVISVFPVPPWQMATGKVALYVLLGAAFSMTSTWME